MVDFDTQADQESDRFNQQLAQFRSSPSRYGYQQLEAAYNQLLSALQTAERNIQRARTTYFQQLQNAARVGISTDQAARRQISQAAGQPLPPKVTRGPPLVPVSAPSIPYHPTPPPAGFPQVRAGGSYEQGRYLAPPPPSSERYQDWKRKQGLT
jgi:hypothetical protein